MWRWPWLHCSTTATGPMRNANWNGPSRSNPGSVTAHEAYSFYQMVMGHGERAVREMDHALSLDPLSLVVNADKGWILLFARPYGSRRSSRPK